MDSTLDRIDAWERDGLIDRQVAARLRAAETARGSTVAALDTLDGDLTRDARAVAAAAPSAPRERGPEDQPMRASAATAFGPAVTVGEMFGYLGAAFLLGAWSAFVLRVAGARAEGTFVSVGFGIAAAALIGLALVLRQGSPRRRRAAGMALFAATGYVTAAATAQIATIRLDPQVQAVAVAGVLLIAAVVFRRLVSALVTELGLLIAVTAFAGSQLLLARSWVVPAPPVFGDQGSSAGTETVWIVVQAALWLVIAVLLGVLAVVEEQGSGRAPESDGAAAFAGRRRAALVRMWAGLVAVFGVWSALSESSFHDGDFGRVLPAWLADVAILAIAAVLTERAFRRDSAAFLFAAGIGFLTALTDFNVAYLSDSTEVGLLIEGAILLAVGFGADRLRRRLGGGPQGGPMSPTGPRVPIPARAPAAPPASAEAVAEPETSGG